VNVLLPCVPRRTLTVSFKLSIDFPARSGRLVVRGVERAQAVAALQVVVASLDACRTLRAPTRTFAVVLPPAE
jgi:hypothetical protein